MKTKMFEMSIIEKKTVANTDVILRRKQSEQA